MNSSDITDDLVGKFLNYLVSAKSFKKGAENDEMISYQSMSNYASSFKNQLLRKFSSESIPHPIRDDVYKKYTNTMRLLKIKQSNALDKPLFGAYKAATDDDFQAVAAITYWSNEQNDAEFLFLINSMVTNCGRGSEVSY